MADPSKIDAAYAEMVGGGRQRKIDAAYQAAFGTPPPVEAAESPDRTPPLVPVRPRRVSEFEPPPEPGFLDAAGAAWQGLNRGVANVLRAPAEAFAVAQAQSEQERQRVAAGGEPSRLTDAWNAANLAVGGAASLAASAVTLPFDLQRQAAEGAAQHGPVRGVGEAIGGIIPGLVEPFDRAVLGPLGGSPALPYTVDELAADPVTPTLGAAMAPMPLAGLRGRAGVPLEMARQHVLPDAARSVGAALDGGIAPETMAPRRTPPRTPSVPIEAPIDERVAAESPLLMETPIGPPPADFVRRARTAVDHERARREALPPEDRAGFAAPEPADAPAPVRAPPMPERAAEARPPAVIGAETPPRGTSAPEPPKKGGSERGAVDLPGLRHLPGAILDAGNQAIARRVTEPIVRWAAGKSPEVLRRLHDFIIKDPHERLPPDVRTMFEAVDRANGRRAIANREWRRRFDADIDRHLPPKPSRANVKARAAWEKSRRELQQGIFDAYGGEPLPTTSPLARKLAHRYGRRWFGALDAQREALIDAGYIPPESRRNAGAYLHYSYELGPGEVLRRMWEPGAGDFTSTSIMEGWAQDAVDGGSGGGSPLTPGVRPADATMSITKRRSDRPYAEKVERGLIRDPARQYQLSQTQGTHILAVRDLQENLAASPHVSDTAQPGWRRLPNDTPSDAKLYGPLAGKYIEPRTYSMMQDLVVGWRELEAGKAGWAFKLMRLSNRALGLTQVGLSPGTFVRNVFGNAIQHDLGDFPTWEQPEYLARAVADLRGDMARFKEAVDAGGYGRSGMATDADAAFDALGAALEQTLGAQYHSGLGRAARVSAELLAALRKAGVALPEGMQAVDIAYKHAHYLYKVDALGRDARAAATEARESGFAYERAPKAVQFMNRYMSPLSTWGHLWSKHLAKSAKSRPLALLKYALLLPVLDAMGEASSDEDVDFSPMSDPMGAFDQAFGSGAERRRGQREAAGIGAADNALRVRMPWGDDLSGFRVAAPTQDRDSLLPVTPLDALVPSAPLLLEPAMQRWNHDLRTGRPIVPEDASALEGLGLRAAHLPLTPKFAKDIFRANEEDEPRSLRYQWSPFEPAPVPQPMRRETRRTLPRRARR